MYTPEQAGSAREPDSGPLVVVSGQSLAVTRPRKPVGGMSLTKNFLRHRCGAVKIGSSRSKGRHRTEGRKPEDTEAIWGDAMAPSPLTPSLALEEGHR